MSLTIRRANSWTGGKVKRWPRCFRGSRLSRPGLSRRSTRRCALAEEVREQARQGGATAPRGAHRQGDIPSNIRRARRARPGGIARADQRRNQPAVESLRIGSRYVACGTYKVIMWSAEMKVPTGNGTVGEDSPIDPYAADACRSRLRDQSVAAKLSRPEGDFVLIDGSPAGAAGAEGDARAATSIAMFKHYRRPTFSPMTGSLLRRASARATLPSSTATTGVLLYRGYPIDQLAEFGSFLEVCHLLLYGELPDPQQTKAFRLHPSPFTRWCMNRWHFLFLLPP